MSKLNIQNYYVFSFFFKSFDRCCVSVPSVLSYSVYIVFCHYVCTKSRMYRLRESHILIKIYFRIISEDSVLLWNHNFYLDKFRNTIII